jgi:hypothetical protein
MPEDKKLSSASQQFQSVRDHLEQPKRAELRDQVRIARTETQDPALRRLCEVLEGILDELDRR